MFASPGIVPTGALLGSRRSVSSVATGADGKGTSGESVPGSAPGTPLWPAVPAWPPAPRSLIPGAQPMSPIPFPRMSTMAATGLFSPETPTSPGARPVARSQSFAGPARTAPLFAPSGPSSPSSIRNGGRWLSTTATPRARPPTGPMAHSFAPGTRLRALEEDAFESDSTVGSDEEDEEDEEEEEAAAAAVRPASMAPPQVAALLRHPPPDSEVVASTNSPAFRRTISRLLSPADLAPPASLALA
ncbi:hypothetical protein H696_05485 [Fonticula alba]|uniref:Uncharacterized protein n=1 Tax=Fonticula alba TaxID=691883 RepID=A0A058Z1N0_FONAL|nr:hypothetical protein H696_05485 [Fonticula alba]KCV68016.1 hypothetical protein H696_05485 [Fonticula alba]|eukprot:XP_009497583.1 hypothetical protein H696_05485 [Fonticula alba]